MLKLRQLLIVQLVSPELGTGGRVILRASFGIVVLATAAAASPMNAGSKAISAREGYDRQMRLLEHAFETHRQNEAELRSLYTPDAVLVEADGNEIHGRDQIVSGFRKVLGSGAVEHFRVTTTTFRTDGKLSYAAGTEDIDERDGSSLRHGRNRFVLVMRRGADGNWRIDYVMEART